MSLNKGKKAEEIATNYLIDKGFTILKRNFYFRGGEIDIIATRDNVIHFIEVKSGDNFEPIYNVTPKKLKRIIKGAYIYLKQNRVNLPFCIDAIIVKKESIEHIENITIK